MRGKVTAGQMGLMRGAQTMPAPREYPLELRERAVRMYRAAEPKPVIRRMAEELGVTHEALRTWIRQAEADADERGDILTTVEREEPAALRKENAQLKRANEVLRAASAGGADLLWRIRSSAVLPIREKLPDGSYLSDIVTTKDHRKHTDPAAARV